MPAVFCMVVSSCRAASVSGAATKPLLVVMAKCLLIFQTAAGGAASRPLGRSPAGAAQLFQERNGRRFLRRVQPAHDGGDGLRVLGTNLVEERPARGRHLSVRHPAV